MKKLGKTIDVQRRKLEFSKIDVSKKSGLSYQAVLNIIAGKPCSVSSLSKVCKVLGLEIKLEAKQ